MSATARQVREWFRATGPGRMADICAEVGAETGVTTAEMRSRNIDKHTVTARHYAMWLARDAGFSYPEIGRFFNRDHTTVMHAVQKIEAEVQKMREVKNV